MNAFEDIVARYFEDQGYWVRQSVKVPITKADKRQVGKPSMPTPEVDGVAFKPKDNVVLMIEAKSYLDSPGVRFEHVCTSHDSLDGRYKLFTHERYREIVTRRLLDLLTEKGLVTEGARVKYVLVAGKIYGSDEPKIQECFAERGWELVGQREVADSVWALAEKGREDSVPMMVVKILKQNRSMWTGAKTS